MATRVGKSMSRQYGLREGQNQQQDAINTNESKIIVNDIKDTDVKTNQSDDCTHLIY